MEAGEVLCYAPNIYYNKPHCIVVSSDPATRGREILSHLLPTSAAICTRPQSQMYPDGRYLRLLVCLTGVCFLSKLLNSQWKVSLINKKNSSVKCRMSNAYVDKLNNFCFLIYAQKWHMSNVKCQVSSVMTVPVFVSLSVDP